jgi:thymidylate kinase
LESNKVIIVSFSGIDGAGKSTQIRALHRQLREMRFRVFRTSFWNHAVVLKPLREKLSRAAFKGDQGVGSPDAPKNRRDKNVSAWYLTTVRCVLYFLDAVKLKLFVSSILKSSVDVAIFDRYIYDELANLSPTNWLARIYVRQLLRFVPKPDLAFLLDVDPTTARQRKPEYPVDFLQKNRSSFLALAKSAGMIVLKQSEIAPIAPTISAAVLQSLSSGRRSGADHCAVRASGEVSQAPESNAAASTTSHALGA